MAKVERLNKRVKELASQIILYNLSDPRIKNVTVLSAEFSIDLRYCKIEVSILGTKSQIRTTMRGLQHARGYIQKRIAGNLQLRYAPVITIELNEGLKTQQDISSLIDNVREEDKKNYPGENEDQQD